MNVWREVRAAFFTAAGLVFAYSVTQSWGWPLLAGPRAGIVALGVCGMAGCASSGMASERGFDWRNPFLLIAIVLGIVVLGAAVVGLFANSMDYLVAMMLASAGLWLVATARHIVSPGRRQGSVRAA